MEYKNIPTKTVMLYIQLFTKQQPLPEEWRNRNKPSFGNLKENLQSEQQTDVEVTKSLRKIQEVYSLERRLFF
jgi:hypothetical protein